MTQKGLARQGMSVSYVDALQHVLAQHHGVLRLRADELE